MAASLPLAELRRTGNACSSSVGAERWIVGKLQLCNCHQATGNLDQCLALSDVSATVCCLIPCFHCELLDQTVRVTAWNYVPGDSRGESRGLLEILYLEPVGSRSPSYADKTFPSLCVNPGAADARDHVLESPLLKLGKKCARVVIQGSVMCISPPFVLPHGNRAGQVEAEGDAAGQGKHLNGGKQSRFGFLVELVACQHEPTCRCFHDEQESILMVGTGKFEVCHVYFSQSVSCWLAVLSAEFGQCIGVTGLRRKSLRVDGRNHSFYVATRTTLVLTINSAHWRWQPESHCQRMEAKSMFSETSEQSEEILSNRRASDTSERLCHPAAGKPQFSGRRKKAKVVESGSARNNGSGGFWELRTVEPTGIVDIDSDELISYSGIVTAIFQQDLLVEMDNSVFMLLTHVKHHGIPTLRPGITLRAHNVHRVVIRNHWTSCVLLGACSRSLLTVEKFCDLNNLHYIHQPRERTLSKYLEHLPFASALWILLLVASFSLKFEGLISEEELVGTKRRTGLIQEYVSKRFAITAVRSNAIVDFLDHEQSCTVSQLLPTYCGLQVPPVSNFLAHIAVLLNDTSSILWHTKVVASRLGHNLDGAQGNEGRYLRRTITGSELGVIFLGCLQVSKTSGKLQLVDGTGAIDLVVPDFNSVLSLDKVYEVSQYVLVLEGFHSGKCSETDDRKDVPLAWSNILKKKMYGKASMDSLRIFLYFHLKEAASVRELHWPVSSLDRENNSQVLKQILLTDRHCYFDVLMVTYKHPVRSRAISWEPAGQTFQAEAFLLPCSLVVQGKRDRWSHLNKCTSADKKLRTGDEDRLGSSDQSGKLAQFFESSVCFPSLSGEGKDCDYFSAVRFGLLKIGNSSEMAMNKVLLEFSSESVEHYTVLQVGECYLLQLKNVEHPLPKTIKLTVGVGMHLWKLHIALQDLLNGEPEGMLQEVHNGITDVGREQEDQVKIKSTFGLQLDHVSDWTQVDVVVKLSSEGVHVFEKLVAYQQARIVPAVVPLRNACPQPYVSLSSALEETVDCSFSGIFSADLVSFTGRVEKVKLKGRDCFASDACQATASLQRQWAEIELCDLEGSERVKVLLSFIPDSFPAGLGPGARTTFQRVIACTTLPDSTLCYQSTSATLVLVHSIPELPLALGEECLRICEPSYGHGGGDLVPELKRLGRHNGIRGRVVRVRRLIFRWQGNTCSWRDMKPTILGSSAISTSAYLTIDDGTQNVTCWATGRAAICLLGLDGAGGRWQLDGKLLNAQKPCSVRPVGSAGMQVAWIVQKHRQVTIQSDGWEGCEGGGEGSWLSINGAGSQRPHPDEQAVFKSLVLQACHNRSWDLVCALRVSKRKPAHANIKRHYLYVTSVEPVEYCRDLKNKFDKLSSLLGF